MSMGFRRARVTKVHPGARRVDLVFLDNGQRAAMVEVVGSVSGVGGGWSIPNAPPTRSENAATRTDRPGTTGLTAFCGFEWGRPVVLGFLHTGNGQAATTEQNRAFDLHPSGTYQTVAPDGTVEIKHASGAYLRLGQGDTAPVPGLPAAPGGAAPARLTVVGQGWKLTVEPGGDLALTTEGILKMKYASAEMEGDILLKGTMTVQGGDVIADGVTLKHHPHDHVQPGSGESGEPVATAGGGLGPGSA